MTTAGLTAVEAAHRDGSWHAQDIVETLTEPDDLAAALDTEAGARARWDTFPRSARRAILEWIDTAKTETTRTRRITRTATERLRSASQPMAPTQDLNPLEPTANGTRPGQDESE